MNNTELPNLVELFFHLVANEENAKDLIEFWVNPIFSLLISLFVFFILKINYKFKYLIPNRVQAFIEIIIESYSNMIFSVLGEKNGRRFLPYIGSLFFFIFISNIIGIVPLLASPTNSILTTASLAIPTFLYVQWTSLRENGILKFLHHLAGSPNDKIGWVLSPFMFCLHVISEIARPFSLSLRLFGNILGEDIVLRVFVNMGIGLLAFLLGSMGLSAPLGIPLQFPLYFLSLIGSFVQAFVFSILTTIYILLILPHDHEEEHEKDILHHS